MSDESYKKGLTTGISDGTTSGLRGADDYAISQKNMARHREAAQRSHESMAAADARLAEEGRKLGEGLMVMVAALFLHPRFSFVGFWLICVIGLLLLASWSGLWEGAWNWYVYSAIAISVVLATLTAPGSGERGEMYEGVDLRICSMSMGELEVCQRYCATLAGKNRPEWCK